MKNFLIPRPNVKNMAQKYVCHCKKKPYAIPFFKALMRRVSYDKKNLSDLVPGTKNEKFGYPVEA